jgi:hypothetical protein
MIDATTGNRPGDIHDSEGNVNVIPKTKELFGDQDTKENVE